MELLEQCQKGDVVRFSEIYYNSPDAFMPEYHDFNLPACEISKALSVVEAVITGFWEEGVWITYRLFDVSMTTNHFYWEVDLTGEKRILNDPARYSGELFVVEDAGRYTQSEATAQFLREDDARWYRGQKMKHLKNWQEWLTVDEQRLYLSILDSDCAAIVWGQDADATTLDGLLLLARQRFEEMSPDNEELV